MQNELVTLVGVGDVMLGRGVDKSGAPDAQRLLDPALRDLLHGHLVTANLECLVTTRGTPSRFSHAHFRTEPDFAGPLLKMFDVVTMANNHLFDFGREGVEDTFEFLDRIGVRRVGVGATPDEAANAATFNLGSCRVDVFGASDVTNISDGCDGVHVASVDECLLTKVAESAASGALVVVHLHAGGGDVSAPNARVFGLHKKLRDAGANVVLGHHPHRVQGWYKGNRSVSFFSLGDFVFDKLTNGRDASLVARVDLHTLDVGLTVARRAEDLTVGIASHDFAAPRMSELETSSAELRAGVAGALHSTHTFRGYLARIVSLSRDFRAGGLGTVMARVRNKWRRLRS